MSVGPLPVVWHYISSTCPIDCCSSGKQASVTSPGPPLAGSSEVHVLNHADDLAFDAIATNASSATAAASSSRQAEVLGFPMTGTPSRRGAIDLPYLRIRPYQQRKN